MPLWLLVGILAPVALSLSTDGIYDLVKRRLPQQADRFEFSLVNETEKNATINDQYIVSSTSDGKILVEGNSLSALSSGLVSTPTLESKAIHTNGKISKACIAIYLTLLMLGYTGSLEVDWRHYLHFHPLQRL